MNSLRTVLNDFIKQLELAKIDSPALCAETILAHIMGLGRPELLKQLILSPSLQVEQTQIQLAQQLIHKRANGTPLSYILGVKEFYGRPFIVNPATLIPRPETELFIDYAKEIYFQTQQTAATYTFADLGTGSGNIAISLCLEIPKLKGIAIDYSAAALVVAQQNMRALRVQNLLLCRANFYDLPLTENSLHLLCSNPPYLSTQDLSEVSPEVRNFEPTSALVPDSNKQNKERCESEAKYLSRHESFSSTDGMEDIRCIIQQAARVLKNKGHLLLEIGSSQGEASLACFEMGAWSHVRLLQDLSNKDRLIHAIKC